MSHVRPQTEAVARRTNPGNHFRCRTWISLFNVPVDIFKVETCFS
jgi:hypothetical protein